MFRKNRYVLATLLCLSVSGCSPQANWGTVSAGKDSEGKWQATLENSRIFVRYGFKLSGESREGMITDFFLKAHPEENIAGHLLDAAAHRGMMINAAVVRDDADC